MFVIDLDIPVQESSISIDFKELDDILKTKQEVIALEASVNVLKSIHGAMSFDYDLGLEVLYSNFSDAKGLHITMENIYTNLKNKIVQLYKKLKELINKLINFIKKLFRIKSKSSGGSGSITKKDVDKVKENVDKSKLDNTDLEDVVELTKDNIKLNLDKEIKIVNETFGDSLDFISLAYEERDLSLILKDLIKNKKLDETFLEIEVNLLSNMIENISKACKIINDNGNEYFFVTNLETLLKNNPDFKKHVFNLYNEVEDYVKQVENIKFTKYDNSFLYGVDSNKILTTYFIHHQTVLNDFIYSGKHKVISFNYSDIPSFNITEMKLKDSNYNFTIKGDDIIETHEMLKDFLGKLNTRLFNITEILETISGDNEINNFMNNMENFVDTYGWDDPKHPLPKLLNKLKMLINAILTLVTNLLNIVRELLVFNDFDAISDGIYKIINKAGE